MSATEVFDAVLAECPDPEAHATVLIVEPSDEAILPDIDQANIRAMSEAVRE